METSELQVTYEEGHGEDGDIVLVRAGSRPEAVSGAYRYITDRCGRPGRDWKLYISMDVREDDRDFKLIRITMLEDGSTRLFSFDITECGCQAAPRDSKAICHEVEHSMMADIDGIRVDDARAIAVFNAGTAIGFPHAASEAEAQELTRGMVTSFHELVAIIALSHPGTRSMLPQYVERRAKGATGSVIHSALDWVTCETYGVPLYQEQIAGAVRLLAGFSMEKANRFRKSAGKIRSREEMERDRDGFRPGVQKCHPELGRKAIDQVRDGLLKYAGYTFPAILARKKAYDAYAIVYQRLHDNAQLGEQPTARDTSRS